MRSARARYVIVVTTMVAWLVLPAPAALASIRAEIKSGPRLEIVGDDAADTVDVTCVGTFVKVNGADPTDGAFECSRITLIVVETHAGTDQVTLEHVDPEGAFTRLDRTEIAGGAGDDTLIGSPTYDRVKGQAGSDTVMGLARYDEIYIEPADVSVDGGGGFDLVDIPAEGRWIVDDTSFERLGPDSLVIPIAGVELLYIRGDGGRDRFDASGFPGEVAMLGRRGDDALLGGAAYANLDGGRGDDHLIGTDRKDILRGRAGDDVLRGLGGRDYLNGGDGVDDCDGGPDPDRFFGCE